MNWYIEVLKKYATFNGRARRTEYWMFGLFHFLVIIGFSIVDVMFGSFDAEQGIGVLTSFYILATIIPNIAVTVRRLHDAGYTGWWALIFLIPLIGPIALLIMVCQNSNEGDNKYGVSPKALIPQEA